MTQTEQREQMEQIAQFAMKLLRFLHPDGEGDGNYSHVMPRVEVGGFILLAALTAEALGSVDEEWFATFARLTWRVREQFGIELDGEVVRIQ